MYFSERGASEDDTEGKDRARLAGEHSSLYLESQ